MNGVSANDYLQCHLLFASFGCLGISSQALGRDPGRGINILGPGMSCKGGQMQAQKCAGRALNMRLRRKRGKMQTKKVQERLGAC